MGSAAVVGWATICVASRTALRLGHTVFANGQRVRSTPIRDRLGSKVAAPSMGSCENQQQHATLSGRAVAEEYGRIETTGCCAASCTTFWERAWRSPCVDRSGSTPRAAEASQPVSAVDALSRGFDAECNVGQRWSEPRRREDERPECPCEDRDADDPVTDPDGHGKPDKIVRQGQDKDCEGCKARDSGELLATRRRRPLARSRSKALATGEKDTGPPVAACVCSFWPCGLESIWAHTGHLGPGTSVHATTRGGSKTVSDDPRSARSVTLPDSYTYPTEICAGFTANLMVGPPISCPAMRESDLLADIARRSAELQRQFPQVLIGPENDGAHVAAGPGGVLVSVDHVIEGRHVSGPLLEGATPLELVGRKAIARSVSDLAAMAGTPQWCWPQPRCQGIGRRAMADELFDHMHKWANHFGCPLVGGDIATQASRSGACVDHDGRGHAAQEGAGR